MTFSTVSSLHLFCFCFALIIQLLICCCARQQSSLDSIDSKSNLDYDEALALQTVIEEEQDEEGKQVEDDRGKRALEIDEVSKKVIMLLQDKDRKINETYDSIKFKHNSTFKINDFIIRLQEKYEYTMCKSYLNAAKGVGDNYFRIPDHDLVDLPNDDDKQFKGDEFSRAERLNRANDEKRRKRRFRFFGEYCDEDNEWYFWRDMFIAAENDTIAIPKGLGSGGSSGGGTGPIFPPIFQNMSSNSSLTTTSTTTTTKAPDTNVGPSGEYDYVQVPAGQMMARFNRIWELYRSKAICNPKYLLECSNQTCKCRTKGIGLPTVVTQRDEDEYDEGDTQDFFTTQYYEDLVEDDKGHPKIHHGEYLHKRMCVVTANLPESNLDIYITNPCDFYLPMIGLCNARCVVNASCRSVTEQEKEAMRARTRKLDFYERIINYTLHEVYHQKCVCDTGKICRKITNETYGGATTVKSTLSYFRYHFIFIFQVIMTGIIAKY